MFDGFDTMHVDVGGTTIFARRKGDGRPLLLLHGFPETHVMWHRVAPVLARQFTVVCADLRGYGRSGKPASTPDHAPYAKSAMAIDMVRLMAALGFSTFSVAGHDRGARVAYRLALDHPGCVERLALLDVIPTGEAFSRADIRFALAFWPWSLLAQPEPLPERLIAAAPDAVVNDALDNWGSDPASFPPEVRSAYFDALSDPEAIHAICEEYRAAADIDFARDAADRAANKCIGCPTLASARSDAVVEPDTSYCCAVDRWGNAMSATPSDGSWRSPVIPGLGIVPSGRGTQSRPDPSHPSGMAPGKRPRLTPNPAIAVRDDGSVIPFGAPGGDVQVQAMLQVFLNTFHFGMDIQEAIEQPRFATFSFPNSFAPYTHLPGRLNIEDRLPPATIDELRRRGHDVEMWPALTRRACSVEAILLDSRTGFLRAGADFRQPAYAIVS